MFRLLISGGPGSGCTSTANTLGGLLGVPVFDSDRFFHKPTNPPFQAQYSSEERRVILSEALAGASSWILSGSVATWGLVKMSPTHGVFLDVPEETRLSRLLGRQRQQFGDRINAGGDMHQEHESFLAWAAGYETRTGPGRNRETDQSFLQSRCQHFLAISGTESLDNIVCKILLFLPETTRQQKSKFRAAMRRRSEDQGRPHM